MGVVTFHGSQWVYSKPPPRTQAYQYPSLVLVLPFPLPSQILETDKPPLADFMAKLQQGHPPPPFRAISYAQMAAKPPAALMSLAYMYVHKGGTIAPMSPLYSGPYQVLSSGPKVFKLQVGEWVEMVSIDHLKPH